MISWFKRLLAPAVPAVAPLCHCESCVAERRKNSVMRKPLKVSDTALGEVGADTPSQSAFVMPSLLPGVVPADRMQGTKMAMDAATTSAYKWASSVGNIWSEGLQFMGYAYLSELTQRAEYRRPSEIIAKQMTRKWIKFRATGDDDNKAEKITAIESEFKRLNVQGIIRKAVELDGYFGRSQIYIDVGVGLDDRDEVSKPLTLTTDKIAKDSLKRLAVVEPMWTYPSNYNSTDPLNPTFYHPTSWFVMGTEVHASRLLTVIGRPVPDMLKPAYAFGGLSLSQMAKPYVDNWLRTRQSVSDLLHSFTVWVLKTDLSVVLTGGAATELKKRAMLFNKVRDVRGLMVVDKETEELANITASIGGLDKLQAQSQEQQSSVTGIPLSILLGITPSGLNASNEGEIRTFYDWVEAQQESQLTDHIRYICNVVQLSKFGEIDPDISFSWEPQWSMSDKERADLLKAEADTDAVYEQMGAIDATEVRTRLAQKEDSPYAGLDLNKMITPPDDGGGDDPLAGALGGADAEFNESDHPRAGNGKFGSGSGGGAAKPTAAERRESIKQGAEAIAAMSEHDRDNTELQNFPGGASAYDLYEARKMAPKPSDKLKKVTDSNSFSLWQGQDYIANVDGQHFGITKQEDPDEPDDESKFIYSFQSLESGGLDAVNTTTDDKGELFKEIRAHIAAKK